MRILILCCEDFKLARAAVNSSVAYETLFVDMLAPFVPSGTRFDVFDARGGALPSVSDFDKFIITGSLASCYEPLPWIANLKHFVRAAVAARRKVVGICFGHQLVAEALGGKVEAAHAGWGVGRRRSKVKSDFLRKYFPSGGFVLEYSHHDQVAREPENAEILSGSDFCPVESMRVGDSVLTFQGHPEFTPAYADMLFEFFADKFSEAEKSRRAAGLALASDSATVARAIAEF